MTILSSTSIVKAGENFVLTCHVNVTDYLTVEPTVQWSGGSVGSGNGVMVGDTTHSGVMSMKTLTFSLLRTSHTALYICQADINIPSIDLRKDNYIQYILLVESKRSDCDTHQSMYIKSLSVLSHAVFCVESQQTLILIYSFIQFSSCTFGYCHSQPHLSSVYWY